MTTPETRSVGFEELALSDDAQIAENYESHITEEDIRELSAYGFDSNARTLAGIGSSGSSADDEYGPEDRTLVGIGPAERAERANRTPRAPETNEGERMPLSEPPGPFVASDDEVVTSLPMQKAGPWALALGGVLAAAAVVALMHGFVTHTASQAKASAASDGASSPATAGLVVNVDGPSPHVLVDGRDRGAPPLRVLGLDPGPHVVSIVDPAYAHYSESVTLTANQVRTITPPVTLVRGTLLLGCGDGAEDARVEITGVNERREIEHLPARVEVAPGEYRIRGTRPGYTSFETTALISPVSSSVEVPITLARDDTKGQLSPTGLSTNPAEPTPASAAKKSTAASLAVGSLEITSSPSASVVLDGRPLGKAPRLVKIAPGVHTVVFIHPARGRMLLNVNVNAGQTTRAAADF